MKTFLTAEHNTFEKAAKKEVIEHYKEGKQNSFFQFMHDGAISLNKEKFQAYGMKFTYNKFLHNNAIALSFRKPVSRK